MIDKKNSGINLQYVFERYQKIEIVSDTGQTFLNRKFVKGQSLTLPLKNSRGKKIKLYFLTLEDRKFELKTRCSSKQLKLDIGKDHFLLETASKKPACIVSESIIEIEPPRKPVAIPPSNNGNVATPSRNQST